MLTTKQIKKDLKKLSKKQLIERVMIGIHRSENIATNLNRIEKELQENFSQDSIRWDTYLKSEKEKINDLNSKISRLENLNVSYKELADRKSGEQLSIEEMAINLYDYLCEKIIINIDRFSEQGKITKNESIKFPNWERSDENVKDYSRAGITRILYQKR